MSPPIYLLAGPTASGKSAKALDWADRTGGVILNADSMQLYSDVPILTARPDDMDMSRAEHVLYGHLAPDILWSTGDWLRAALPWLDAAQGGGRPVCVTGGTGLYFNSLVHGLAEIPDISEAAREKARRAYVEQGEIIFRENLNRIDPRSSARIYPNDAQRLTRAWEVWLETGVSLSDWQDRTQPVLPQGSYKMEILMPEREDLYASCDNRLQIMLNTGALDEVRDLMQRGLRPDWPILRVLGLAEFAAHIEGRMTLPQALDLARQKTRNYAKRQTTFFRNQFA